MKSKFLPKVRLADFAAVSGESRAVAGNIRFRLSNPDSVWFVEKGAIDILATEFDQDDQMLMPFRHIARLKKGQLAFGTGMFGHQVSLVAKGIQNSVVRCFMITDLIEQVYQTGDGSEFVKELIAEVDVWIERLAFAIACEFENRPNAELHLSSGPVESTGVAFAATGVMWLRGKNLHATFLDVIDSDTYSPGLMPFTRESWIRIHSVNDFVCCSSLELGVDRLLSGALPEFHRLILCAEEVHRRLLLVDDVNLQVAQAALRHREKIVARRNLSGLVQKQKLDKKVSTPLGRALKLIGKHEGFSVIEPPLVQNIKPTLNNYCEASCLRWRKVRLTTEDRWWLGDSGCILVFRINNSSPMVLLPNWTGSYRIVDPETEESSLARPSDCANLCHDAYQVYSSLLDNDRKQLGDLLRASVAPIVRHFMSLIILGLFAGSLTLAPAIVIRLLAESVIPSGELAVLFQFCALLTGLAFMAALAQILRGMVMMRIEGRLATRISATIQDRLLRLKLTFFRGYSSGELTARSLVFQDVRDHISGITADTVLSVLFTLPALGLLFYHNALLGLAATVLTVLSFGITAIFCVGIIHQQRHWLMTLRQILGELNQFFNGITKLRTTGAEDLAFATWAQRYKEHKNTEIKQSILSERLTAITAAVPAVGSAVLFSIVATKNMGGFTTGDFLTIHTAAMVLFLNLVMLGNSAKSIAFIKPACEQVMPIIAATPEPRISGREQKTLEGGILIDRVTYGYTEASSNVLEDISIYANPGEFIAIVGESGAGKSTILRLAIGLIKPCMGAVYYDGRNLSQLDVTTVRRQIGVVPQDGFLQTGNVFDNIAGLTDDFGEEEAWNAARMAGLEEDIRAMPMGLYTPVGENAPMFSGGQIQRIRIAAALIHKPRIIFLDEPTSWLDNKNQSRTMRAIRQLTATRIVIAHRLSTIRMADRIYVLAKGKLIQTGGFDELLKKKGKFRELALRQST